MKIYFIFVSVHRNAYVSIFGNEYVIKKSLGGEPIINDFELWFCYGILYIMGMQMLKHLIWLKFIVSDFISLI